MSIPLAIEVVTLRKRVDLLEARVELMHAHVENLIERVYSLEGDQPDYTDDKTPGTLRMDPPAGHGESWGDAEG